MTVVVRKEGLMSKEGGGWLFGFKLHGQESSVLGSGEGAMIPLLISKVFGLQKRPSA